MQIKLKESSDSKLYALAGKKKKYEAPKANRQQAHHIRAD